MRKVWKISLFIFLCLFSFLKSEVIEIFESPSCPHCKKLKKEFFPQISRRYNVKIIYYDLGKPENFKIYAEKLKNLGLNVEIPSELPVVFYRKNVLAGEEIEKKLPGLIEEKEKIITKKLKSITLPVIVGSGLVDGINPCAFAVIIFFISFLLATGKTRREIFLTSVFYIPGVFLTYFFIGLLLKEIVSILTKLVWIKFILLGSAGVGCFLFAFISFSDWKRLKRGDTRNIQLRLPDKLKKGMNRIIGRFVMKKYSFISAFFLGSLVSVQESVCTGQVYIPVILLLSEIQRKKAIFYLFLYNFFFILPLIFVFFIAFFGTKTQILKKIGEKNPSISKFIMGICFLFLGILLVYFMLSGINFSSIKLS